MGAALAVLNRSQHEEEDLREVQSVCEGMNRDRGWERRLGKKTKILKRRLFLANRKEILLFPELKRQYALYIDNV